jgi:hypothetical protein
MTDDYETCILCNKPFDHQKRYYIRDDTPKGLKEVEIICVHPNCRDRRRKLKEKILNLEFELFCLKDELEGGYN